MKPVVELEHITMEFPGVKANDDVSLTIDQGEIFALVGENGAGKTTLMNILYGILTPTAGQVRIKGRPVTDWNPRQAIAQGVGMVHQHFMLVPSFTVAQNIVLSREPRKMGLFFDDEAAQAQVRALSQTYSLHVEPGDLVSQISVGQQQRVEILKTLYRGADVLILDEPTAVLTPQETQELFAMLRRMVEEKHMTVILITHKLYEVMAISDRVGVMRQGKLIGVEQTKDVNERILSTMMVGREIVQSEPVKSHSFGEVQIQTDKLWVQDDRGLSAVKGLSLQVRAGEILGIAAIEGNGQSELLEAITGMRPITSGQVLLRGEKVNGKTPGQLRDLGMAHVPEDRMRTGVCLGLDIADNLLAGKQKCAQFQKFGIHQNRKSIRSYAQTLFDRFDIRAAGVDVPVGSLSGGNMQKVVVAREFSQDAQVLVISQPTRGVDVGAIAIIHRWILEKREAGAAILLCSADLDEVFRLSDRIITIYEGRVTGTFAAGSVKKEELGYYMTGDREERGHEA